jgi:DNA-binding transcriptional LysR family regulator
MHAKANRSDSITFQPHLSINEYSGLAAALLAGIGIGELPPIVQPNLLRDRRLIEVMPAWHFRPFKLSIVQLANRYVPRAVRIFKDFAAEITPTLFPKLPE